MGFDQAIPDLVTHRSARARREYRPGSDEHKGSSEEMFGTEVLGVEFGTSHRPFGAAGRNKLRSLMFGGFPCSELPEKPHVVLDEQADVVDAVLAHGDPLDA